jgi:uncharacterized protein (TIGR03437 family)
MVSTELKIISRVVLLWILVGACTSGQTVVPMFTPPSANAFPAGSNPRFVAAGDFNGDQISDVAIVNPYSNSITVLLGSLSGALVPPLARGTQTPSAPVATGNLPSAVAAGYFRTGNATPDLAVANLQDGSVWIFFGDGYGNFTLNAKVPVGVQPSAIAVSDFDLDGNLDLAVTNAGDGTVILLFGDGQGGFSAKKYSTLGPISVGSLPTAIAAGTFGGLPGFAVANQLVGTVTVVALLPTMLADGTTTFAAGSAHAFPVLPGFINPPYPYPVGVAVADVNGDGYPDIITANDGTNNISVLLGDSRGTFTFATGSPIAVGASPMAITSADFNGDGNPDLAVANYGSGNVSVLLGNGAGAFTPAPGSPFPSGASSASVAIGDFNGVGRLSLAVANQSDNTVSILLNGVALPLTAVSEASLTAPISPGSVVTIEGLGLGSSSCSAPTVTTPNPCIPASSPTTLTLNGTSVTITYANNVQDTLQLYMASPTQVSASIPANPSLGGTLAPGFVNPVPGLATISVLTPTRTQTTTVEIAAYAPALFSANQTGTGVAMATFTNPLLETSPVYQCVGTPPSCVAVPLNLSHGGTLTLSATGLNNATTVEVTVGSQTVTVPPTPQVGMPGMYQFNVPLKANPTARGIVPVQLTVTGQQVAAVTSNVVTLLIQ